MVVRRLSARVVGWAAVARKRVAAAGPATAEALAEHGVRVEAVPDEYRAEALVERLRPAIGAGDRVLLPRAKETRDVLVVELRRLGATVTEVPAYQTRRVENGASRLRGALAAGAIDAVTFTSSSTARNFAELIASMPGQFRMSIDELVKEVKDAAGMGIPAVLLFGVPAEKDPRGSEAYAEDGIVQQAVRAVKDVVPDLLVVTDVCLCQYTSHGHCGIVEGGSVRNDPTLELLARVAVSHAEAGADMVAPSDMMDGRVGAIREALDEASFTDTPIMAYPAKDASSFHGPFPEAADSAPTFGDRRSYQTDPADPRAALRHPRLAPDEGPATL